MTMQNKANNPISGPERIAEIHRELWEIIDSGNATEYVVEDIIPLAMQIAGRMEHIADVINPNWQAYVYQTNPKVDGLWLFNDLFGDHISKIVKELQQDYPTPDALAELLDYAAPNVFEVLGGAWSKPYTRRPQKGKKRTKELADHAGVSELNLHWGGMLLLIIVHWSYIWRVCKQDMKMYSYTRSVFWLNETLSNLSRPKSGYGTAKNYKEIKDIVLKHAAEIKSRNPSLSANKIGDKIYLDLYGKDNEFTPQYIELSTIRTWVRKNIK